MDDINFYQIIIFLVESVLVSILILSLFRLRQVLSLSMLYAVLGLFQFMQVFLASTVYVEVATDIFISPGSTILFTSSLFAVLLIYIKEDAIEVRKIIYALLISNIIVSVLLYTFGWNFYKLNVYNSFNVSADFLMLMQEFCLPEQ